MRRAVVLPVLAILVGSDAILAATEDTAAVEVPLKLFTSASYPSGVNLGGTMGVSFGDFDGDGFPDIVTGWTGNLWRNAGGAGWQYAANLSNVLPPAERRYGWSFGDYDSDGFPDIAISPRVPAWGDDRMHLLHNGGAGGSFVDVAGDRRIVDEQPYGNGETLCWADVNGDGHLDLFIPAYPSWANDGPGNFFLFNEGPAARGGAYRFVEASLASGLDNPPGTARPEGAQFVDLDGDGDVDLFSNGTLYQNDSTEGEVKFEALTSAASGIGLAASLDEGAMSFDYDLDGDFDVVVVYTVDGVRIWENRGDGTFFQAETGVVDAPMTGLNLGMSAEDWDNDGDIDFTTRGVFRRNRMVEDGARHFTVATTNVRPADLVSATPAWGDWDRDGDLDCALGNWGLDGWLYENTTYTQATAASAKRYLRVRPVRDSRTVARGLETEYGATVEVRAASGSDLYRRRKFTASSHGYLNQNEYAVHFGLPNPGRVDVSVDFPGRSADGAWRVDKKVNPALGGIDPAALVDRELTVTRCGEVKIDGVVHDPIPLATPRMSTTTGGLVLAGKTAPAVPTVAPQPDWYTGLAFDTFDATGKVAVKEILLDGQLDAPVACGAEGWNVAVWDVTDPRVPALVTGARLAATTSNRNHRSVFPTDFVLQPGRAYRLVARVTSFRQTTIAAPDTEAGVTVRGGLSFSDHTPCNGKRAATSLIDADKIALAIRFAPVPSDARIDPVSSSLRLSRTTVGRPRLSWDDLGAAGYRVLRCRATAGACVPEAHADAVSNAYTDPDVSPLPGESLWYVVKALNDCAAGS